MAIATINPATGEVLKTFEPLSDAQIEAKLQLAAERFHDFRKLSFAARAAMMNKAAEILERDKDELGRLMTLEMGKTFRSAVDEAVKCAWACRYYAENAESYLADEEVSTNAAAQLRQVSADGRGARDHAVEFSVLAGVPVYRAGTDGRECGAAEACVERAAVRAEDRRDSDARRAFPQARFRRC